MQAYEPSVIETAINATFPPVVSAASFTQTDTDGNFVLDQTKSFLTSVEPLSAGNAFTVTVGGNVN